MPLNLISDAWIPVLTSTGKRIIRPGQIAELGVIFPDWLNAEILYLNSHHVNLNPYCEYQKPTRENLIAQDVSL